MNRGLVGCEVERRADMYTSKARLHTQNVMIKQTWLLDILMPLRLHAVDSVQEVNACPSKPVRHAPAEFPLSSSRVSRTRRSRHSASSHQNAY